MATRFKVKLANKLSFTLMPGDIISDGKDEKGEMTMPVKLAIPYQKNSMFGKRHVRIYAPWFVLSIEKVQVNHA